LQIYSGDFSKAQNENGAHSDFNNSDRRIGCFMGVLSRLMWRIHEAIGVDGNVRAGGWSKPPDVGTIPPVF